MKKKVGIILAICLIAAVIIGKCSDKPRIVSSITTMDTAYITVLVPRWNIYNVEQLKEKLIQMCLEDEFLEIKLTSESDLTKGKEFMNLKWENLAPAM